MAERVFCRAVTGVTVVMLSLAGVGCRVVDLENPWEKYYDAEKCGVAEENISEHFNMHRGRWWNYYTRGACYLEHGHYSKARDDFATAIAVRGDVETRDARTYGMHFMDYFPHREAGIAFCLEATSKTGGGISQELIREAREKLLGQAIEELRTSLGQEESSRAKHYLNQARKALWETNRNDRTAPVVHVNESIYTNEQTVRFAITVTDDQSGVEEIRLRAPGGGVNIGEPRLLVELAQEEVIETVVLTVDAPGKVAVVEITAFDLAGNESRPYKVHVVFDTQPPMAAVTLLGAMQPQGRFAAFVRAVDDFGLQEIQVGADQNDRFSCYGKGEYSGTVLGTPTGDELHIRVIDNAGNAVVAGIPVGGDGRQARLSRAPWRPILLASPLGERMAEYDSIRCFSPARLIIADLCQPSGPAALCWEKRVPTAPFVSFGVWSASEPTGPTQPQFHFLSHVQRPDGAPKETSQDFFVVEGTLHNGQGVTAIKVDGLDVDPSMLKRLSMQSGDDLLFSQKVDLTGDPMDRERLINVQYQVGGRWAEPMTLSVIRRHNCLRDDDAVYRAVLLVREVETAYRKTIWRNAIPKHIYDAILTSVKNLQGHDPEPCGGAYSERLRIRDVSLVLSEPYAVAVKRSVDHVRDEVGAGYDVVIYGDIGLYAGGGEEELDIKLKAMDIVAKKDLEFHSVERGDTDILAETRVPCRAFDEPLDSGNLRGNMGVLPANVGERLPRVQAEVRMASAGTAESVVSIDRGREDGLFEAMCLCFYTYGDASRIRNVYLKRIGDGRVVDLDGRSSRIYPRFNPARIESGLVAITR